MSLVGRFGRGSLLLVAVPILSLIALWAFAASITLGDALHLRKVDTLNASVGEPTGAMITALQQERRASMAYLGSNGNADRGGLVRARRATDKAVATFRSRTADAGSAAGADTRRRISDTGDALDTLTGDRNAIDNGNLGKTDANDHYSALIDDAFRVYRSLPTLDDPQVAKQRTDLVTLARAREYLSREDAVAAAGLAAGRFTKSEHARLVKLVGTQRQLYSDTISDLSGAAQDAYRQVVGGKNFTAFHAMEDTLVSQWQPNKRPKVDQNAWRQASARAITDLRTKVESTGQDQAAAQEGSAGTGIIVRLVVGGLVGLLLVIASIYLSIRLSRSLMRQLGRLRQSALRLAYEQLPSAVERLRHGIRVDVDAEAPPLEFGTDEIGQVGTAFNTVHRTAIRAAVEQAELRVGVSKVFLNTVRRSQTLLNTQLAHLDVMERKAAEPEALEDLFRIDHLATRMRRNAENLVVLGGGAPGRTWREPVPLLDVLRSAASEVENYERVRVLPFPPVMLAGSVVSDVVHLAAELIDNAASFSPPHTRVHVTGQSVPKGFVVEIEDRGLGMSEDAIKASNRELADPPEFDMLALSDDARLGMFVVARIAARHDIKVHLRSSPYGGTTAIILLPAGLVAESGSTEELSRLDADRARGPREDQPSPAGTDDTGSWPRLTALPRSAPHRPGSDAAPVPPRSPAPRYEAPAVDPVLGPAPSPAPAPASPAPAGTHRRTDPERPGGTGSSNGTHRGLPKRVRQASLAPGLRADTPPAPHREEPAAPPARSPEEIRSMMSAYQRGTVRGRKPIEPAADGAEAPPTDGTSAADTSTAPVAEAPTSDAAGHDETGSGYGWPAIPDIPLSSDRAADPAENHDARRSSPAGDRPGPTPVPRRHLGGDDEMDKTTELAAIEVGREERT